MLESLSLTMHKEKYNINWHTYSDHLKEMLHEMMKSKMLHWFVMTRNNSRLIKLFSVLAVQFSEESSKIFQKTVQ